MVRLAIGSFVTFGRAGLAIASFVALAAGGCSGAHYDATEHPSIAVPAHLTSGPGKTPGDAGVSRGDARVSRSDARSGNPGTEAAPSREPTAAETRRRFGSLPDPPALQLREQWEYELLYDGGKVDIVGVRFRTFDRPVPTARQMGRYAIELWIGRELIERTRFDFPGLAAEPAPRRARRQPLREPPTLAAGARVRLRVLVPASPRATRAFLVDRATGEQRPLPWPPEPTRSP